MYLIFEIIQIKIILLKFVFIVKYLKYVQICKTKVPSTTTNKNTYSHI